MQKLKYQHYVHKKLIIRFFSYCLLDFRCSKYSISLVQESHLKIFTSSLGKNYSHKFYFSLFSLKLSNIIKYSKIEMRIKQITLKSDLSAKRSTSLNHFSVRCTRNPIFFLIVSFAL